MQHNLTVFFIVQHIWLVNLVKRAKNNKLNIYKTILLRVCFMYAKKEIFFFLFIKTTKYFGKLMNNVCFWQ